MPPATELPLLHSSAQPRLIDLLLAEQQTLPAVQRFAQWHDAHESGSDHPVQIAYRSLIPLSLPQPGEQYAFEVDLDTCSGCKACVTACHSLNGLEEHETWRDVGLLISNDDRPNLQFVTSACHHCVEPACLSGCPVKAYDKDPVTGIVRHLDDQCIGCQYCVLMCPYDVPKYSAAKGIVRKCDMCRQRLAANAPPACVAACPNQAIRITTVRIDKAIAAAEAGEFLSGAPDPALTTPTTRYVSDDPELTDWFAADAAHLEPAHTHWPLVLMLVLTQASVGVLMAERGLAVGGMTGSWWMLAVALLAGVVGGQAAMLHLGRPFGAWRAWLGLHTSWLSREIVLFGAYAAVLTLACLLRSAALSWAALSLGIVAVFSSAMIYAVTQRPSWKLWRTGGKFLLTTLIFASIAAACRQPAVWPAAMALMLLKLIHEAAATWHSIDRYGRVSDHFSSLSKTARLLRGPLQVVHSLRMVVGFASLVAMAVAVAVMHHTAGSTAGGIASGFVIALVTVGEILERTLFFASCPISKMPGGLAT